MRKYLLDKKEDLKRIRVEERSIDFKFTKNFCTSVVGPRRAGKTYSLFDLILNKEKLREEDYLFLNFEDAEIKSMDKKEIIKVIPYHYEIYSREPSFLFFDEVQAFPGWESFIYSLFEKKRYHIFITGSSSKLLPREIATQLRGRSLPLYVLPFSFKEFVRLKEIEIKKIYSTLEESALRNLLRTYLKLGGFPDVELGNVDPGLFFRDYTKVVVARDVIERFKVRNPFFVELLADCMIPSFSKEFSIHKIFRDFKSRGMRISKKTLYLYSSALEESFFCFLLKKFSFSIRETLLSIPKIYINDPGLISHSSASGLEENIGRLMENVVFLELKRKQNEKPLLETFYWKDYASGEVDFVVKEGPTVSQLIQVSYASGKDEIEKREIRSLLKASEQLKCGNLLLLTWDFEDELKADTKVIKCLPLWRWLLE